MKVIISFFIFIFFSFSSAAQAYDLLGCEDLLENLQVVDFREIPTDLDGADLIMGPHSENYTAKLNHLKEKGGHVIFEAAKELKNQGYSEIHLRVDEFLGEGANTSVFGVSRAWATNDQGEEVYSIKSPKVLRLGRDLMQMGMQLGTANALRQLNEAKAPAPKMHSFSNPEQFLLVERFEIVKLPKQNDPESKAEVSLLNFYPHDGSSTNFPQVLVPKGERPKIEQAAHEFAEKMAFFERGNNDPIFSGNTFLTRSKEGKYRWIYLDPFGPLTPWDGDHIDAPTVFDVSSANATEPEIRNNEELASRVYRRFRRIIEAQRQRAQRRNQ